MKQLNERYFPEEEKITRHGFISHMEKYMKDLLTEPKKARPDSYLQKYGIDWKEAQKLLLTPTIPSDPESAIMRKEKKIITGFDGKDKFVVKYYLPRKDYRKKMKRLFIQNFESNIISELKLDDDISEATVAACSGSFSQPLFGEPIRRKTLYITQEQKEKIKEATAGNVGQGEYVTSIGDPTSPFYRESMSHKNMMRKAIQK